MTAKTEPRSGLQYGWDKGEAGWNGGMDANLLAVGRIGFHLSIKNSTTTTPPGSPSNGDTYIVGASATGAWSGKASNIVVWDATLATPAWTFYVPRPGWIAFDESSKKLRAYYGGAWSAGIAI